MTDGWQIKEELDHVVDAVIDAGRLRHASRPRSWTGPRATRRSCGSGAGDPSRFE